MKRFYLMFTFTRNMRVGLLLLLVLLFTACNRDNKKNYIINVECIWSDTHPMIAATKDIFKTQIEKKTKGRITVNVLDTATEGAENDPLWENVRNGKIQAAVLGSTMNNEWPVMLVANWPFLYRDLEHAKNVWTSSFATEMSKKFHEKFPDAYILSWGPNSSRSFTSSKKLTSLEDFKGQTFRVPNTLIHTGIVESLGATAKYIKLQDLYDALKNDLVDGQENGMVTIISEHYDNFQKYFFETNHIISVTEIMINADFYNTLPQEYKTIINNAAKETTAVAWDNYIGSFERDREYLKSKGVTVTICSPEDSALFVSKINALTDKLVQDNLLWAPAVIGQIKAIQ